MPELRCPMCGKLNPETAEVCVFCQARLRPLQAAPPESQPPIPPSMTSGGEASDWLAKLRAQGAAAEPSGTRDLSGEPEVPAGADEVPNWLARIRSRSEEEGEAPPPAPPPDSSEVPRSAPEEVSRVSEGEQAPAEGNEPEWLKRLRVRRAYEQEQEPEVSPFGGPTPEHGEELPPDWLHVPREEGWPAAGPAASVEQPGGEPPEGGEVPPAIAPGTGLPPQRAQPPLTEPGSLAFPASRGAGPDEPAALAAPRLPRLSPFTQGSEEVAEESEGAEIPEWLARVREGAEPTMQEGQLPTTQPEEKPVGPGLDELLAPGVLPEWLTATQPPSAAPQIESEGIEHAVLPPWLQALRPIEGPAIKTETSEEERVETAGPLSGLKGVLPPITVFEKVPHPPVQREQLEVNPAHAAQAELLQRVVINPESREAKRTARPGQGFRAWTLGVWALLLAAILTPAVTQAHIFARPTTVSVESLNFRTAIDALPDNRPILMAFEFDPADAAEMEAGALAVVDQLMGRGIPIATLSTRPAGSAMAADVIARAEAEHPDFALAGKYLPLGYLPGDAVGLRSFAIDPRRASGVSVSPTEWDSPFLTPVTSVEGFSSIIVVVAQPQLFQAWMEQVHTLHPGVPVFAVISAAAEPLVRPYYESNTPSVEGLVVGLAGAETYACMNSAVSATGQCGSLSPVDSWWDSFGASTLMAVLVLGLGAIGSAGIALVKRVGEKNRV